MVQLRRRIIQLSNYKYSVLLVGSSGSGKCTAARSIHQLSNRNREPFIPVDCSRLPGGLFRSQVFGHTAKAMAYSNSASRGCFDASQGGTIYFKKIDCLDSWNQDALAEALTCQRSARIGQTVARKANVRIMASTEIDLADAVRQGRFRSDLYYQVAATKVHLDDLVGREDDITALTLHFLAKCTIEHGLPFKQLSPATMELLKCHSWPGNIRELEEAIESAVLESDLDELMPHDFPSVMLGADKPLLDFSLEDTSKSGPMLGPVAGKWQTLAEAEAAHIRRTLRETYNNLAAAANLLGLTQDQLRRKMETHAIDLNSTASG